MTSWTAVRAMTQSMAVWGTTRWSGALDLDVLAGQADSDTLIGPNVAATWAITGAGAGQINEVRPSSTPWSR